MKTIILGAACVLTVLFGPAAVAEEGMGEHGKPTMEEQCKAMGMQHGMKEDKMDAWMKRCMEIIQQMKDDMRGNDSSGADDSEDPQDGDRDMGDGAGQD